MNDYTYAVGGMTCENCKRHVTEALSEISGVTHVEVDLEHGRASVRSQRPLSNEEVTAALDEAGYELV